MARNRIIFLILWIISLVGISFYGGAVSYGFFTLLTLLPVFSLLYICLVRFRFRIFQYTEGRTFVVGQKAGYKFSLQNEDLFGFAGVRVKFLADFSTIVGFDENEEYELFPLTGLERETELICKYRGKYDVGVEKIMITDYLRLFTTTVNNTSRVEAYVHPRLVHLSEVKNAGLSIAAARTTAHGDTLDVLTREYRPGDDIRHINWKVSARRQQLMVRKTIGEDQPGVGIIMDSCRYGRTPIEYLPVENKIIETVLALSYYYLEHNVPVQSIYLERELTVKRTDNVAGYDGLYGIFSDFEFKPAKTGARLFTLAEGCNELYRNRMVVMVLHRWCAEAAGLACTLSSSNIPVVVYLINDDGDASVSNVKINRSVIVNVPLEAELKEVL